MGDPGNVPVALTLSDLAPILLVSTGAFTLLATAIGIQIFMQWRHQRSFQCNPSSRDAMLARLRVPRVFVALRLLLGASMLGMSHMAAPQGSKLVGALLHICAAMMQIGIAAALSLGTLASALGSLVWAPAAVAAAGAEAVTIGLAFGAGAAWRDPFAMAVRVAVAMPLTGAPAKGALAVGMAASGMHAAACVLGSGASAASAVGTIVAAAALQAAPTVIAGLGGADWRLEGVTLPLVLGVSAIAEVAAATAAAGVGGGAPGSVLAVLAGVLAVGGGLQAVASEEGSGWLASISKRLDDSRRTAVAGAVGVLLGQGLAVGSLASSMMEDAPTSLEDAVGPLVVIMVGVMVLAGLVIYIALPFTTSQMTGEQLPMSPVKLPMPIGYSGAHAAMIPQFNTKNPAVTASGMISPSPADGGGTTPRGMLSPLGRGSFEHQQPAIFTPPVAVGDKYDFSHRLESLAHFRKFLQGAGPSIGIAAVMKGSSNAIASTFPGATEASISFCRARRSLVNAYQIIGEGASTRPKMGLPVAPGTLTHYVLTHALPAYIADCESPTGSLQFADVQFMRFVLGLKSAACLPLRLGSKTIGVLTLGFARTTPWEDATKSLAKQLANIFATSAPCFGTGRTTQGAHGGGALGLGMGETSGGEAGDAVVEGEASSSESESESDGEGDGDEGALDGDGELAARFENMRIIKIIGVGGFGHVYLAKWRGETVACKVMEHGNEFSGLAESLSGTAQFENKNASTGRRAALLEGAMTSAISHPNVVHTYDYHVVDLNKGVVKAGMQMRVKQETHIIMEYCDRDSLHEAIQDGVFHEHDASITAPPKLIDFEAMVECLVEVTSAMEHLHCLRITHRDLKPKNILLKTDARDALRGFVAKVSDFGLSQVLADNGNTHVSTRYSGTVTHMPPELIEHGKVYPEGDVYAFGIIMWELWRGDEPYSNMKRPQIMVGVVSQKLRPKFTSDCPTWYSSLVERCWHQDPKERPSFAEVLGELKKWQAERIWEKEPGGWPVGRIRKPAKVEEEAA